MKIKKIIDWWIILKFSVNLFHNIKFVIQHPWPHMRRFHDQFKFSFSKFCIEKLTNQKTLVTNKIDDAWGCIIQGKIISSFMVISYSLFFWDLWLDLYYLNQITITSTNSSFDVIKDNPFILKLDDLQKFSVLWCWN